MGSEDFKTVLTFDIWPSWSWDIWDTLVVPGQFWLWYGWKLFSHEDFTQILTYRGTAMSGFLRGCLWLSPNWTNWPEILHVSIFWEATWPLQKQNLFWPPNVIGLYRGHMTLTWTNIKWTSQKVLTCKISCHLVYWGLSQRLPPVRKTELLLFPFKLYFYSCSFLITFYAYLPLD